jgi:thioredoxin 1
MASPLIVTLTTENFESEVLKSPTPVLVDFWAEWCGPCKQIAPVLDELSEEFKDKFKIGKVNVEQGSNQDLAVNYKVSSIPLFLVFKGGEIVGQQLGIAGGKAKLKTLLNSIAG